MEANLNQFRLLTVDGEQKANAMRKGPTPVGGKSCDLFNRQRSDGCGGEVLESPTPRYNDEGVNNNPTESSRSATPTPTPSDGHADPTSPDPVKNNCVSPSVQSVDTGYALSPTEKDISDLGMQTGCTTTDRKPGLVGAIESLEKTIQWHCQLLNRKKDRGPITKSPSADSTTCRVPVNSIHPKTTVRTDKVLVYVRVVFLKIGEIDTMKENFMADAFVQARWREPALDGQQAQFQSVQNIDDIEWDKFWNPKLYVENNLGEPKETIWQTLSFNTKGDATVYERRRIKGCFLENLELDEFPFDTQDLTLTITSERAENELELEEDASEISSINVQSFVDEQEWELHSHVETWKRITTKIYQNSKFKHPSFSTSCRASRRPGFFIWNIFLVMLFICSLTFATFSVELTKPENRLQLSFILLLTTITFKFVVSQTLPRISYLTYLDKYILTSMAILCGVCVWHAVIPLFKYDIELAKKIDKWGIIISGSSYFLFHIFFFLYIYIVTLFFALQGEPMNQLSIGVEHIVNCIVYKRQALKKRWKYDQKDKDHKERVKKLQTLLEQGHNAETRTELPV